MENGTFTKNLQFIRRKDFQLIREIGQGGTGRTVLLRDDIIDEYFVCKKYEPYFDAHKDQFFDHFVQEIKILHLLFHKNIVRFFQYFLYRTEKTGYILMEYVLGSNITDYAKKNPDRLSDLFEQIIDGFSYLEKSKILHRDIRPENILVSEDGTVKIIDFGFGKVIDTAHNYDKSISLNWRYPSPSDFGNGTYDFCTEIYFVGKLFEDILTVCQLQSFTHSEIITKMSIWDRESRISSFQEIETTLKVKKEPTPSLDEKELLIYRKFASFLTKLLAQVGYYATLNDDVDSVIANLRQVYRNSALEPNVINSWKVASCFINGAFTHFQQVTMETSQLKEFIDLLVTSTPQNKKIILNNLLERILSVERTSIEEDLPF